MESDRCKEWYNSIFQNILKNKKTERYSKFTDKCPSIAERVFRTLRSLLGKPVFEKGKADWLRELPFLIKNYNKTIYSSTKMTPIQASRISNGKNVCSIFKYNRQVRNRKFNPGQLVRKADMKRVLVREIQQIIAINYIQSQKVFMKPSPHMELTLCPRDIIKTYFYQVNFLLNKKIKL